MKLEQTFTIARPVDAVWAVFQDIPVVAACLPGAEYMGPKGEGRHGGRVSSKIGPFQASFEGEAAVAYDELAHSIFVDGKGLDRKGGSRGRMTMKCVLTPAGEATAIAVDSDVQLSGAIAQFGRTGIIAEIANAMVAEFVRNVETKIPPAAGPTAVDPSPAAAPSPLSGWRLFVLAFRSALRRIVGA